MRTWKSKAFSALRVFSGMLSLRCAKKASASSTNSSKPRFERLACDEQTETCNTMW